MSLHDFFQINILTVGIFIFMIVLVIANRSYELELTKRFIPMLMGLFLLIIIDNFDYAFFENNINDWRHIFVAATGYNIRIGILINLLYLINRKVKPILRKILLIPGIICIGLTCLAFFTDFVFYYNENGDMVRGPFAYLPHITLLFYSFLLIKIGIQKIINKEFEEGNIIILGCLFNIASTYAEFKFRYRGLLMGTIALAITFYYLYLHTEYLKKRCTY